MHMSKSKREIIDTILKRQKDIASSFLEHKYAIHEEDPEFLDEMSEVFDLRHWNVVAFDTKSESNQKDKAAEDEIDQSLTLIIPLIYSSLPWFLILKFHAEDPRARACAGQLQAHILTPAYVI